MPRDLSIYLHGRAIGTLRQEDSGRLAFSYSRGWLDDPAARPLSLSLPLQQESFDDRQARPFFAGLLPDETARERLARFLGVSHRNDFALLAEVGGECAGAVALYSPGSRPPVSGPGDLEPLDEMALATMLRALPRRPLFAGGEIRISLAGAQDKMALVLEDDRFFLPRGDRPTTHILKPAIEHFAETVSNEFFCLRLAERMGLRVPRVDIGRAEGLAFLIVERYDRSSRGDGVVRLHQEDFCQALGIAPERKYQAEGGPSLAQCFTLLDACRRPALDRLELLRRILFNFLIGNADAHGKNFALLHLQEGSHLAPAYDLLCTRVYPEHTDRMAMKIGGKNRAAKVLPRHWQRFARESGLAPPRVRKDLETMAVELPEQARLLADDLQRSLEPKMLEMIGRIVEDIRVHCQQVLGSLDTP